jgi:hypothetical protein
MWAVLNVGSRGVRQLTDRDEDERTTNEYTEVESWLVFIGSRIRFSYGIFWTQLSAFQLHDRWEIWQPEAFIKSFHIINYFAGGWIDIRRSLIRITKKGIILL